MIGFFYKVSTDAMIPSDVGLHRSSLEQLHRNRLIKRYGYFLSLSLSFRQSLFSALYRVFAFSTIALRRNAFLLMEGNLFCKQILVQYLTSIDDEDDCE